MTGTKKAGNSRSWKEEVILYYSAPLRLSTRTPLGDRGRNVISKYRSPENPDWQFQLRASVSRTLTARWLLCKALLQRTSLHEQLILLDLAADIEDLAELLILANQQEAKGPRLLQRSSSDQWLMRAEAQCRRVSSGYQPRFQAIKAWDPRKVVLARRIGVGYKDHGTLATAPSWKDQMLLTAEEFAEEKGDNFLQELKILLSFSEYLEGQRLRLTSPSRAKRKGERE